MNKFFVILILVVLCVIATLFVLSTKRVDTSITTEVSLTQLEKGNARFVSGNMEHPNLNQEFRQQLVAEGQEPSAVIVACSDSRVGVEFIFDAGIGDLFVIRTAGNVISTMEAASIEFAVKKLGVPLCIVLGHTHCGAVAAAVHEENPTGNLGALVDVIEPVYEKVKAAYPDLETEALMDKTVELNVWNSVETLYRISEPIAQSVDKGYLRVVGGIYDLETGAVRWLDPTAKETPTTVQPKETASPTKESSKKEPAIPPTPKLQRAGNEAQQKASVEALTEDELTLDQSWN